MYFRCYDSILHKGLSTNYVVSVEGGGGEGGSPEDDLLNRPYLKKTTRGGHKFPILRQHGLWTAPKYLSYFLQISNRAMSLNSNGVNSENC